MTWVTQMEAKSLHPPCNRVASDIHASVCGILLYIPVAMISDINNRIGLPFVLRILLYVTDPKI